MKISVLLLIFVVAVFLLAMKNIFADSSNAKKKDPKEVYIGLRQLALEATPETVSQAKPVGKNGVYGVLMEIGMPEGSATLAAFITGDASIYFSSGGGVIGGIGHEAVRNAAMALDEKADAFIDQAHKTTSFPIPDEGQVLFYILTESGIYTAQASEEALGNKKHALSPLFVAGHEVITQLRLIEEKH